MHAIGTPDIFFDTAKQHSLLGYVCPPNLGQDCDNADKIGPFGNPSADSDRTKISLKTNNVMFVVFAPVEYKDDKLKEHLDFIESKIKQYHDCKTVYNLIA